MPMPAQKSARPHLQKRHPSTLVCVLCSVPEQDLENAGRTVERVSSIPTSLCSNRVYLLIEDERGFRSDKDRNMRDRKCRGSNAGEKHGVVPKSTLFSREDESSDFDFSAALICSSRRATSSDNIASHACLSHFSILSPSVCCVIVERRFPIQPCFFTSSNGWDGDVTILMARSASRQRMKRSAASTRRAEIV